MKQFAVRTILWGILISPAVSSAPAATLLGDFEHSMKKIERNLCSQLPSAKCKSPKQRHKAPVKKVPHLPIGEVPVITKPAEKVPVEKIPQNKVVVPETPKAKTQNAPPILDVVPETSKVESNAQIPPRAKRSANTPKSLKPIVPPAQLQEPALPKEPAEASKKMPAVLAPKIPAPVDAAAAPTPVIPPVLNAAPPVPVIPPVLNPAPPASLATVPAADSGCLVALSALGTSFAPVPQPTASTACQIPTPVRLFSIASKIGSVKLPDTPVVNCAFAMKFSTWVDKRIQDIAQQQAGSAIVAMGTGPGFDCRGRNGDSSSKMSEHAIGDAVDIVYIRLANKEQILVKDALLPESPHFTFLRDMRAAACLDFTTVLGPGANAAHVSHFHIDLEQRRGGFRLCE